MLNILKILNNQIPASGLSSLFEDIEDFEHRGDFSKSLNMRDSHGAPG